MMGIGRVAGACGRVAGECAAGTCHDTGATGVQQLLAVGA